MADAKIEFKAGSFSFTGEGTEQWLSSELEKLLTKLPDLIKIAPAPLPAPSGAAGGAGAATPHKPAGSPGTLASFLKAKSATTNQVKKFLATAVWLHDTTGKTRLETSDVTDALNKNNQGKLTNAAQCLNNNNAKGHAEKDGDSFYITDEGRQSLGA